MHTKSIIAMLSYGALVAAFPPTSFHSAVTVGAALSVVKPTATIPSVIFTGPTTVPTLAPQVCIRLDLNSVIAQVQALAQADISAAGVLVASLNATANKVVNVVEEAVFEEVLATGNTLKASVMGNMNGLEALLAELMGSVVVSNGGS